MAFRTVLVILVGILAFVSCKKVEHEIVYYWVIQKIDFSGNVGQYTSHVVDTTGNSHITYYNASNGYLKYAKSETDLWQTQIIDPLSNVGQYCDITLDSDGYPYMSYYDVSNGDLNYAYWDT
jgi:hypothetical protein